MENEKECKFDYEEWEKQKFWEQGAYISRCHSSGHLADPEEIKKIWE